MKHSDYWRGRFEQLEESLLQHGLDYYDDLEREYRKAAKNIEKDISVWYQRLAVNNDISFAEAKRLLNANELKEFHWTVDEYIKHGRENAVNQQWIKQLENASAKVHISRLEAMKLQLQQHAEVLYGNQLDGLDKTMRNLYADGYYRTAFEVQKGLNVGYSLHQLDDKRIEAIISKPWAADGKNFSDRIWQDKNKLISNLHTELTQSTIRGDPPRETIQNMAEKLKVSRSAAGNLITTESAFFSSVSQRDAFISLGVEEYEIVATLDSKTSSICREMDGKIFKTSDYKPGITANPFHCRCRSCTAPHFADNNKGSRAARGEDGKTYYVPADMKYEEWKSVYVDKSVDLPNVRKEMEPLFVLQDMSRQAQNLFDKYLSDEYIGIDKNNAKFAYYDMNSNRVIINPEHQLADYYDIPKTLVHELVHLLDDDHGLAVIRAKLLDEAMSGAETYIMKHEAHYRRLLEHDYANNMSISDIFSNLTINRIYGNFTHSNSYWGKPGTREKELIAALLTEYITDDQESLKVIRGIPALSELLEELIKAYDKITGGH